MLKLFAGQKSETVKPKKRHAPGSKRYELHKQAKKTLGSGDLKNAVKLPKSEDLNEWLAANTVDFYNQINLIYGIFTEQCTPKTCPLMSAGDKYEYLWAEDENQKPEALPAPEYVDKLMTWIQMQIDNENIFPETKDVEFPKDFQKVISKIFKKLFRVYAHLYYSHYQKIVALGVEAHINTCFKHYFYFVKEFNLVPEKDLIPLKDLIKTLTEKDEEKK